MQQSQQDFYEVIGANIDDPYIEALEEPGDPLGFHP